MKLICLALTAGASMLFTSAAFAQDEAVPKDIAFRQEIHAIPTQTLSDEQFLKKEDGVPATTAGILRLPQSQKPFPAMVIVHGSSGMGSNIDVWERLLNGMGIATFAIDAITGRDLQGLGDKQATLGRLNFMTDTFGALKILAEDDRIDNSRIGVIGFSRGGQAVLYAAVSRFNELWNDSGITFANYIPFYPNCVSRYNDDDKVEDAPIRIFHGEADDYNPLDVCLSYVERLEKAGADVEVVSYPDTHHAYDFPDMYGWFGAGKTAQTARNCRIEEGETGILMNLDTNQQFSYEDDCVELGPHYGGNPEAAEDSKARVAAFLQQQFGLE